METREDLRSKDVNFHPMEENPLKPKRYSPIERLLNTVFNRKANLYQWGFSALGLVTFGALTFTVLTQRGILAEEWENLTQTPEQRAALSDLRDLNSGKGFVYNLTATEDVNCRVRPDTDNRPTQVIKKGTKIFVAEKVTGINPLIARFPRDGLTREEISGKWYAIPFFNDQGSVSSVCFAYSAYFQSIQH